MSERPNVLFILTDQHRLDAIGCYADTPCRTPHIDGLADEGVRFQNAYTPCPVCTPARASILTGEYPHNHGLTDNVGNVGCSFHEIPDRDDLLSTRLRRAGYALGYTGKWHLCPDADRVFGVDVDRRVPSDLGFEGQDFPGHGGGGWRYPSYRAYLEECGYGLEIERLEGHPGGNAGIVRNPTEATVPYFLAEHTISLLDRFRDRDRPFFLWHNFWGPHEPYYPSTEFFDQYRDITIPPWPTANWPANDIPGSHHCRLDEEAETRVWEEWAEVIRHYYAFTTMIDAQVGRILDHLDESGLGDDTIVVFAADHGETLGSHGGLVDKGFHHFEEILRVPFIIRFPDRRWANATRDELVSLLDLYPTFLEAANVDVDRTGRSGESLFGLLRDGNADWRDEVVAEFHGLGGVAHSQRTLRTGDLKYGYNPGLRDELYDLSVDPHETRNLIDTPRYQTEVERLRARLVAWQDRTGDGLSRPDMRG